MYQNDTYGIEELEIIQMYPGEMAGRQNTTKNHPIVHKRTYFQSLKLNRITNNDGFLWVKWKQTSERQTHVWQYLRIHTESTVGKIWDISLSKKIDSALFTCLSLVSNIKNHHTVGGYKKKVLVNFYYFDHSSRTQGHESWVMV